MLAETEAVSSLFGSSLTGAYFAAGIGAGLCMIGIGYGISKIAAQAMDGTARQPEAAGAIRTSMIISAALIEGAGFFSLIICILLALKK